MKKVVLALLILVVVGASAFAFDVTSFPDPINKGDFLISPTFSFGSYYGFTSAIGITGAFDFALPTPIALTAGLELGIGMLLGDWNYGSGDASFKCLPILARIAWHPNFEVPSLDPYVTFKVGYNINLTGEDNDYYKFGGGFSYGFNAGVRYFVTPNVAIFGELGYDRWGISFETKGWYGYGGYSWSYYIYTWVHVGVTFRIGSGSGSSSSSSSKASSSSSSSRYMRVNADSLNVRKGPSADTASVGALKRNDRVEVLDRPGQWWKIRSGNIEGYVNSSFLR